MHALCTLSHLNVDCILKNRVYIALCLQVGEQPQNTNYSCSPSVGSVVRTIYELDDFSTMTTDDIKDWVLDNLDVSFFYFNEGVDEFEQIYRVRSFLNRGLLAIIFDVDCSLSMFLIPCRVTN